MPLGRDLETALKFSIAAFVGAAAGMTAHTIVRYDEEIEELYLRLGDCEEKISETENHELKK